MKNYDICDNLYDCCDCGTDGDGCGCGYCFSCNACPECLNDDDSSECENVKG